MARLVVGIGNPGRQYAWTRHNIGFLLLDLLASRFSGVFREAPRLFSAFLKIEISGKTVIFIKPTTYVNLTGKAVLAAKRFFDISVEDILVVADDINREFGSVRFRQDCGAGGHNGVRNTTQILGSNHYWQLRLGIGRPSNPHEGVADYVLANFSLNEKEQLNDFLEKGIKEILPWLNL
ncbi:aminoacyl-tRNA hydrolase [Chlamydia sp.]|uniref:aminoacyl-tRNA hydrolase n=1 Tax=Chlamydia sp. TaxID=35827 RepID=UPI0025C058FB|nr:aminoacyl-tRNA hydrolase [Chlamydia sp.]MBQ8498555.1 aminoacyl-tRNA hydrolase [Chlamydia sp.]